jgi:hypothetical protein
MTQIFSQITLIEFNNLRDLRVFDLRYLRENSNRPTAFI